MINYLVTAHVTHTMQNFLDSWGSELRNQIRIVTYEMLPDAETVPAGTWVFSDIERLSPAQRDLAAQVWAKLRDAGQRTLNHPHHVKTRFDLLTALRSSEHNAFGVWRASESGGWRYPVFLREADDHGGSLTGFLQTQDDLDRALVPALMRGHRLEDLLVVEYCDTRSDDGIYRKYSAFNIGGAIIPRHLIFSDEWVVKAPDLINTEFLDEERIYLEGNPHEEAVREVFAIAAIDYGRIDYGVIDGKIQTWEINTNPVVMLMPEEYDPRHILAQEHFAHRVVPALAAIDTRHESPDVPIQVDPRIAARVHKERAQRERTRRRRVVTRQLQGNVLVRGLLVAARPLLKWVAPTIARLKRR